MHCISHHNSNTLLLKSIWNVFFQMYSRFWSPFTWMVKTSILLYSKTNKKLLWLERYSLIILLVTSSFAALERYIAPIFPIWMVDFSFHKIPNLSHVISNIPYTFFFLLLLTQKLYGVSTNMIILEFKFSTNKLLRLVVSAFKLLLSSHNKWVFCKKKKKKSLKLIDPFHFSIQYIINYFFFFNYNSN